ncbi:MAG TPA: SDR family oxidoreductase [Acidimicrobiales bacterium]|nr:SDR family oxidoreductase [Acidimicrobiales bacterium]
MSTEPRRVLVAGATGYLGKFAVRAFKERGYWVRALTRSDERLAESGPFTAPGIGADDVDEVFVGELTEPQTLDGLMDGIDIVFSCVGISRQRDGLTFDQVDYACNHTLIQMAEASAVEKFVYVSMQGADKPEIAQLAITKAHEKVVAELRASDLDHRIVRPCGYFSDMGALVSMAKKGRALLVGDGSNKMSPIHGRDLAQVCVDVAEGSELEVEAGGPEVLTQRKAAELAFDVVGKKPKIHVIPLWFVGGVVKAVRLLSKQFGDLAEFIVVAGEVDGVGPPLGTTTLRSYFERLAADDPNA